jgi:hypothetical protein
MARSNLQVHIDAAQEAERQLLSILPFELDLPLYLPNVPEQILQLGCLRREKGQVPTRLGNEAEIQSDKAQRGFVLVRGG